MANGMLVRLADLVLLAAAKAFCWRGRRSYCLPEPCRPVGCLEPICTLHLSDPAELIGGPFHAVLRTAKCGDPIQVRVTQSIIANLSKCAAIVTHCPILCPVGVYGRLDDVGPRCRNAYMNSPRLAGLVQRPPRHG